MRFNLLTIFPGIFESFFREGIIRRSLEKKKIEVVFTDIRDFAVDRQAMTDDRPYGGGEGMVMKPRPLAEAIRSAKSRHQESRVILLTPQGQTYNQEIAARLSREKGLILICGRYEGVDERIREFFVEEEISIGDYILTGGEPGAMVIVDSVTRLLPGVLGSKDSALMDTFSRGGLKYPQYTRPRSFEGKDVPNVLLTGDHARIEEWRFIKSVQMTRERRPDLFAGMEFSQEEKKVLKRYGEL
ncbi:MAG: tRNA (guanosine(37)-N1)-methyltransferase TrmD [Thermodesulfobacteriota bacterium]